MPLVRLKAPNGKSIVGTLETVPGCAWAATFEVLQDNALSPEYSGETDVWWDGQETVRRDGEDIYLDEDYEEWPESKLIRIPIEEGL